ncbi:B12-binding domain-containing radical SAM protein [Desulfonatronospira sp.]|uniref:B12-binding domain-containing radical SAM protein n=1 Tax=Desulfonatronospira sp. TaxID=1962951 RepID=UPI0025BBE4F2|nr:B12-binding domain-containing radical SAM protein [Desulfonatronospira sp.]
MRTLLVYPQYPDTFWSFKHALRFISKKAAYPPTGLLTVAAMLPGDWEKRVVDLNVRNLSDSDIDWADMVLVSAMLVQDTSAREVIRRSKEKGKTVVAGGPAFTSQPESYPEVDHLVLNEAETTLPLFLQDLEKGTPERIYSSQERPALDRTPVPDWSLIDMRNYASMAIQYSRGCPYQCEFCDIVIMNGRRPRTKSPEQMIKELETLYNAGWRGSLFIVDDNFIGNKRKVKKMLASLKEWQAEHDYPFVLFTEASVELADDQELMDLMRWSNFNKVFLGLETPNKESLQECGKSQNSSRDLVQAVETIHRNGMLVMGGFIVGFDNDNESIFESQIRFIQQSGVVTAMVGLLGALPRTRLWERLQKEGRLLHAPTGENTDGSLNFIPRMGTEPLLAGYRDIVSTIYSPKYYYQRIETFLKSYRPTSRSRINRHDIIALLRSIWRIGIFSRSAPWFWKVLIKTAVTKTRALPEVVELSIFGHHFQRIYKRCRNP